MILRSLTKKVARIYAHSGIPVKYDIVTIYCRHAKKKKKKKRLNDMKYKIKSIVKHPKVGSPPVPFTLEDGELIRTHAVIIRKDVGKCSTIVSI